METYTTTNTVTEEVNTLTGKTKVISSINRTKISNIARELTDNKLEAKRLARIIRYQLLQGNNLKEAVRLATQGEK
jgi:hypothetical protein